MGKKHGWGETSGGKERGEENRGEEKISGGGKMVWRKNNDKWVKTGGVKGGRRNSVGGETSGGEERGEEKKGEEKTSGGGKTGWREKCQVRK